MKNLFLFCALLLAACCEKEEEYIEFPGAGDHHRVATQTQTVSNTKFVTEYAYDQVGRITRMIQKIYSGPNWPLLRQESTYALTYSKDKIAISYTDWMAENNGIVWRTNKTNYAAQLGWTKYLASATYNEDIRSYVPETATPENDGHTTGTLTAKYDEAGRVTSFITTETGTNFDHTTGTESPSTPNQNKLLYEWSERGISKLTDWQIVENDNPELTYEIVTTYEYSSVPNTTNTVFSDTSGQFAVKLRLLGEICPYIPSKQKWVLGPGRPFERSRDFIFDSQLDDRGRVIRVTQTDILSSEIITWEFTYTN